MNCLCRLVLPRHLVNALFASFYLEESLMLTCSVQVRVWIFSQKPDSLGIDIELRVGGIFFVVSTLDDLKVKLLEQIFIVGCWIDDQTLTLEVILGRIRSDWLCKNDVSVIGYGSPEFLGSVLASQGQKHLDQILTKLFFWQIAGIPPTDAERDLVVVDMEVKVLDF